MWVGKTVIKKPGIVGLSLTTGKFNPLRERSIFKGIFALAVIAHEHLRKVHFLSESVSDLFLPSPLIAILTTSIIFLNSFKVVSSSKRLMYPLRLFFTFSATPSSQLDQYTFEASLFLSISSFSSKYSRATKPTVKSIFWTLSLKFITRYTPASSQSFLLKMASEIVEIESTFVLIASKSGFAVNLFLISL